MSTTVSYTTDAVLNVVRSKIPAFHKDSVDVTLRNRIFFPLMKKWGTMALGVDVSWARIWNAKNKLTDAEEWVDTPDQDFESGPEQQQYSIGVGGYIKKESMSEQEIEMASGSKTQIFNLHMEKAADCQTGLANKLNYEALHGTGVGKRMSGIDAMLGTGAATAATDIVASVSGTYAGQNLALGVDGTWGSLTLPTAPNATLANDWPENPGAKSPEYDWTTPLRLVVNGPWESGREWKLNCFELLRYWCSVQKNRGGKVTDPSSEVTALMGERMHREFRTLAEARNYRLEPVQEAINIGMPKTVYYEDTWVTFDSDVAHNVCYMLQPDMIEFFTSPKFKNIWAMDGPYTFKPEFRDLYAARTLGNFRFHPKFFGDIRSY